MIDIHISLPLHALHMMRRLCGDELHPQAAVIQEVLYYLRETYPREYKLAYITPAGGALQTAVAAARHGGAVRFHGAVGSDHNGILVDQYLNKAGITCSLQTGSGPTGVMLYCRFLEEGQEVHRQILGAPGAALEYTIAHDHDLSARNGGVYLEGFLSEASGIWNHPGLTGTGGPSLRAVDLGSPHGAVRVLPLLKHYHGQGVFVVFGTTRELYQIQPELEQRSGQDIVVVEKRGSSGAACRYKGRETAVDALILDGPVHPFDTVGAGDVFAWGFLSVLLASGRCDEHVCLQALHRGTQMAFQQIVALRGRRERLC